MTANSALVVDSMNEALWYALGDAVAKKECEETDDTHPEAAAESVR
jgi:hypothetical protein